MQPADPQLVECKGVNSSALLSRALLIDLEVSHLGRILKIGASLGELTLSRSGTISPQSFSDEITRLSSQAECLLGHNLIAHDVPALRRQLPELPLFQLPVIDTLILSPICFPQNPYHRLVKDYKLVRESLNDPVADARQAAALFVDEFDALDGIRQKEHPLFDILHFLLATPDDPTDQFSRGMALLFASLGGSMPTKQEVLQLCRELIPRWGCASVPITESLLATQDRRLTLAYTLVWLRVAGSNSVLPPWVRLQFPETVSLIKTLREIPCSEPSCCYCRRVHNSLEQLRSFFNYSSFRPTPQNASGASLQQEIAEAGMRNESLLAILPTGGGKSICFQLPALVRNYRRGVLTIVLSPLQALMKDQVDGLVRRTNTSFAAALYGLLTPPERSDVLRRIRMGDIAILYVSPEQLRNRSFSEAIASREIGCWVFDEAHCLSKWGHDFRTDYLYAGRFIREFSKKHGCEIPSIACFTATAKQDVQDEILAYFKNETGRDLKLFPSTVERPNLHFDVQPISDASKFQHVHDLLSERLPKHRPGTAIVFRATRNDAELTASFLTERGWTAAHFHAGLTAPEKKRIQDAFLAGQTRVICATNAFGMGIDKDDVRLVIHADTPGSLENYLQEAGRAGRDGQSAECILLFTESDCERQFRMEAFSELSRRDIAQILRSIRKAAHGDKKELVVTTGELLRDQDMQADINLQDRLADTKVRTAISWLERANFLQRDENVTTVFQARPLVKDIAEATARLSQLNLSQLEQSLWLAILREIFNTPPTESITVDRLSLLPEFVNYARGNPSASPELLTKKVLGILRSMSDAGIMKRDMLMTAYVRHKLQDSSQAKLETLVAMDRKLVDLLALAAPDAEGWMPLSLRLLNQSLINEGFENSVDTVRSLIKSLSEDGRGFSGTHGSIDLRFVARDCYKACVRRPWTTISALADKRRRLASVVLDTILKQIPADVPPRADLLVEFHFDQLHDAIERDLLLRSEVNDIDAAIERALMFLHEQRIIVLQQGLAIFRSAMTIRFEPEASGEKYKGSDYQPLEHHYKERILQVHVMSEYARLGLQQIQAAYEMVLAYFTLAKTDFLRRYFSSRTDLLQYATTASSFNKIVTELANPAQIRVVSAPASRNMLILAGPGSGKTKVVVHRCAYLLRVERVHPQCILVCCFNRHAAFELRKRISDLVGDDAKGVTVLTYHALAMRLLGYSYSAQTGKPRDIDFDALIAEASSFLRGEKTPAGVDADETRARLLAGFQYILVDEYQDIDEPQYEMISAIAGRTIDDPDLKLSILAVGDDDQNIYTFRGANVRFIRQFETDYNAEIHHLVENYRSTRNIIEAANALIASNQDRMKSEHPIRIDRRRAMLAPGGDFQTLDAHTRGKVQVIGVPDSASQAQAVIAELSRLHGLGITSWSQCAVLSRERADLAQVRTLAERASIPIRWVAARNAMPPLHQIREVSQFLTHISQDRAAFKRASELRDALAGLPDGHRPNPWKQFIANMLDAWEKESGEGPAPVQDVLEFFYETCTESRREVSYGEGVTLSTVHSAKGTEYDHVMIIGPWRMPATRAAQEEERRTLYVGLTRARKTLAIIDRLDARPSIIQEVSGTGVLRFGFTDEPAFPVLDFLDYTGLTLENIHLGYAGQFPSHHPLHTSLAALYPGDKLTMRAGQGSGIGLFDNQGTCVARLSRAAQAQWEGKLTTVREVRVLAMVRRTSDQDPDEARRARYRVQEWEVPIVEIVSRE